MQKNLKQKFVLSRNIVQTCKTLQIIILKFKGFSCLI